MISLQQRKKERVSLLRERRKEKNILRANVKVGEEKQEKIVISHEKN